MYASLAQLPLKEIGRALAAARSRVSHQECASKYERYMMMYSPRICMHTALGSVMSVK